MKHLLNKIGTFLLDIVEAVVTALAIFVIIWLFFFQAHQVKGASMHPTFESGDYLLTDKISYRLREPQRGDIIVFHSPKSRDDYIKRIVALPGEEIKLENNTIYINNEPFDEGYLPEETPTRPGTFLTEGKAMMMEEGNYFVLGDNRNHSSDSRDFGPIKREEIVGRAWLRYWPITEIGLVRNSY